MRNKLFGKKIDLITRLEPNELWRRITATSDAKKIAFFAASGFEGNRRFLYTVSGSEIKVNIRRRRKGMPPILTMHIEPTADGSRIKGKIAVEKSSWIFLAILMSAFFTIGTVLVYSTVGKFLAGQPVSSFTPFDFIAPLFLINALIIPLIVFFRVNHDQNEIFEWLKSLVTDAIVKI